MTREHLFAAFFFAALFFLLYQFYLILAVFITPIAWAAILALVFYPAQARLARLLRNRPGLASFVLTTLVIALVIIPTILLGSLLVNQAAAAYQRLQDAIDGGQLSGWLEHIRLTALNLLGRWIPATWQTPAIDIPNLALRGTNYVTGFLMEQATGAVRNVFLVVVNFFLTTFALFFFFRDGDTMARYLRDVIPMEAEYKDRVMSRFYDTLAAVVQGALLTAVAQGVLSGIGYWIVGVPFAVLFGFASGFLSLLPAGSGIVWVPISIYLAITDSWVRALILFGWGALVVSSVDNFIRPWVIGERTNISTVFLFFGILGGLQVYGFLGMFLGPVIIATLVAFVQIYREQYAAGTA